MKLAQLARLVRADLSGSGEVEILGVADPAGPLPDTIVYVADPRRVPEVDGSPAAALLIAADAPPTSKPALRAANHRAAFARLLAAFGPEPTPAAVHPTAVVDPSAQVAADAAIAPQVVVGADVVIGAGTRIGAGTVIGAGARIGAACVLHANVTIYPGCVLGDRVIIHAGVVIGSDGFGYAFDGGAHVKIPHLGRVVIEDDVEIGANTTIDRGTLGETRIGRGTKIDNLCQIAHNVTIGPGSLVVAQVGIAGSSTIGAGVVLAGQAGVSDHQVVGDGARILARAAVFKAVPPGAAVSGFPARDHREELRSQAAIRRLPELLERVAALEARLGVAKAARRVSGR